MLEIPNTKTTSHNPHTNLAFLIEHYIEEYSGEYNSKTMYANFSKKMTLNEFNRIIKELVNSGKIAIDSEGKICYIWDPESVKETLKNKKLAFRQ